MTKLVHPVVERCKSDVITIVSSQKDSTDKKIQTVFERVKQYADQVYARTDRASIIMQGVVQICHLFPTEGDIRANKVAMQCLKGLIQGEEGFCGLNKMGVFIHADRNGWYETGTTCAELKDYRTVLAEITDFNTILRVVKLSAKDRVSTLQNLDFLRQVIESARDLEKHDIAKQVVEHVEKYLKDTSEMQFFYKWLLFKRFYSVTPADKIRIAEYKEDDAKRGTFLESVMQQAERGLETISKADITVLCELRLVLKQDEYIQKVCLDLEKALRGSLAKVDRSHQLFPVINSRFRLSTEDDLEAIKYLCLDTSIHEDKTHFEKYIEQIKAQLTNPSLKPRMIRSLQDVMGYMRSINPNDPRLMLLEQILDKLNPPSASASAAALSLQYPLASAAPVMPLDQDGSMIYVRHDLNSCAYEAFITSCLEQGIDIETLNDVWGKANCSDFKFAHEIKMAKIAVYLGKEYQTIAAGREYRTGLMNLLEKYGISHAKAIQYLDERYNDPRNAYGLLMQIKDREIFAKLEQIADKIDIDPITELGIKLMFVAKKWMEDNMAESFADGELKARNPFEKADAQDLTAIAALANVKIRLTKNMGAEIDEKRLEIKFGEDKDGADKRPIILINYDEENQKYDGLSKDMAQALLLSLES